MARLMRYDRRLADGPGTGTIPDQYPFLSTLDRSRAQASPNRGGSAGQRTPPRCAAESEDMMKIGFIGLGIMGTPMARPPDQGRPRAVPAHAASVPDGARSSAGGAAAPRGEEVAQQADIVIIMVPDTPDVEDGAVRPRRRRRRA